MSIFAAAFRRSKFIEGFVKQEMLCMAVFGREGEFWLRDRGKERLRGE